jgi:uncharacterized GH25 family protein
VIRFVLTGVLFFTACLVQAHEFWMQPTKYRLKAGEELMVAFSEGADFIRMPWPFRKDNIKKLSQETVLGSVDLRRSIAEGPGANLTVPMKLEGTHLFVLQNSPASQLYSSAAFDEYLTKEGLDPIYHARKKRGAGTDSVTEMFSIHSKLLVQVGQQTDDTFSKEVGLPLEIVPLQNPYSTKLGEPLHFKILFNGKPLFGAQVFILNRYKSRTTIQKIYTQKDGVVETTLSNNGSWLVRVIKMVPVKGNDNQYESFVSTMDFGT